MKYVSEFQNTSRRLPIIESRHHGVHCLKSVLTRSYSGPYSVRMRENNSKYGHFLRSGILLLTQNSTFNCYKLIKWQRKGGTLVLKKRNISIAFFVDSEHAIVLLPTRQRKRQNEL